MQHVERTLANWLSMAVHCLHILAVAGWLVASS